jgi:hypothetical protein
MYSVALVCFHYWFRLQECSCASVCWRKLLIFRKLVFFFLLTCQWKDEESGCSWNFLFDSILYFLHNSIISWVINWVDIRPCLFPPESNPRHPCRRGVNILGWQTGLWSTKAKAWGIVPEAAWHWNGDSVASDAFGALGSAPSYVCFPFTWGCADDDCLIPQFLWTNMDHMKLWMWNSSSVFLNSCLQFLSCCWTCQVNTNL